MELVEAVLSGDRRVIARLITRIENDAASAHASLAGIYPHTGRAHIIGVTGAPGTGKSTLVNELAKTYRASDQPVGIVAVDPTSPFSGGAILGDRIRMRDLAGDPGVFVRSMATRGGLGGLARATADTIKVLDAAGFETIIVETVGAGQSEVEIAETAHTVVVVDAIDTNLLPYPTLYAQANTTVAAGTELRAFDKEDDFYLVETPNGELGWLFDETVIRTGS